MHVNEITVSGRLANDPQFMAGTTPDKNRVWCLLAVMKDKTSADFIPFVAWGTTADEIQKYCRKGKQMMVQGNIVTARKARPDGTHDNYFEINASKVGFGPDVGSKNKPNYAGIGSRPPQGSPWVKGDVDADALSQRVKRVADNLEQAVKPNTGWTMKSAYEANKKAEVCVNCGTKLSVHPSVGVMYCKCVEDLPK
jgi:single-strand DNA-binding protein